MKLGAARLKRRKDVVGNHRRCPFIERAEHHSGEVADRGYDPVDIRKRPQPELTATLDCTSGWAFEGTWRGARLGAVLDAAGSVGDRVEVRSVTGWSTSLPLAEARACLLAWSLEGQPIPVDNGAPLRLVAPDHRGVEWVKWISSIRVS